MKKENMKTLFCQEYPKEIKRRRRRRYKKCIIFNWIWNVYHLNGFYFFANRIWTFCLFCIISNLPLVFTLQFHFIKWKNATSRVMKAIILILAEERENTLMVRFLICFYIKLLLFKENYPLTFFFIHFRLMVVFNMSKDQLYFNRFAY